MRWRVVMTCPLGEAHPATGSRHHLYLAASVVSGAGTRGIGWQRPPRGLTTGSQAGSSPALPWWPKSTSEVPIHRLVLWNIDLTLLDVGRVTREAYAEAFRRLTGRPLVRLPQMAGRMEAGIFFEALALNDPEAAAAAPGTGRAGGEELLARFGDELAQAFAAREGQLREQGRLLPGAAEAVAEVSRLPGVVQSVLTGTIKQNALLKLRAFGLLEYFDTEVGGYGSQAYPKGAQLLMTRTRAAEKYGVPFDERRTVYLADSSRDVAAARTGGARCVAVASGRCTVGELRRAGADWVFEDLADTAAVVQAIDRLTLAAAG